MLSPFIPWTPENPHLYDLTVTMGQDCVRSYFGMRKFSVERDDRGVKRLFLNNKPCFHNGLLDQGYYSDGMYTAPSDEAMIFDIQTAKDMGFNMLRKHIKIEPLRWYYHCDRLGMLVWQDMINGGGAYHSATIVSPLITGIHFKDNHYKWFARVDPEGRRQYYAELEEMIHHLYNAVSIAMWVPFNEGWGQFDAKAAAKRILELDTTRTIDHASGWHDQYIGDIKSLHVYFKKYRFKKDKLDRAVVLSEFGGYNYREEGHCYNEKDFGYKRFKTREELLNAYRALYENEILPAKRKGLCAAVYTQLTDVEDELNGLITYDRKVVKLPIDAVKRINEKVKG
jgi:beta-galactosidase/beta-glucuronidase